MVTEAGSCLRLIDSCIPQFRAQGPSRTCNENQEEEEEDLSAQMQYERPTLADTEGEVRVGENVPGALRPESQQKLLNVIPKSCLGRGL